ncbi:hypothetical protein DID78_04770 [Candidatus Marinamargulisbacteria bacterium SCGC AG-343-D04]|nr:hypothetical protein DID78_04770 [Candidatus Marinamargulisbacteria bacterium SCGC AG-343-D04]
MTITNLEQKKGISIAISQEYLHLLNDSKTDEKTRLFLKEKHEKAKELYQHLENRHRTIEKLMHYICNKQHLFFQHGHPCLIPLLQKQVAHDLSMNPSTISRILSSKFCRTPFGIFPLKYLCPRNYFGKTNHQFKKLIEQIFLQFPKYSDQKISNILLHQGISIARRTIAKYRLESGLSSSYFQGRKSSNNQDLMHQ